MNIKLALDKACPASSQLIAPAGTTFQPSLAASFITSQTSAMEPGETSSGDAALRSRDAETRRWGDAETFSLPTIDSSWSCAVSGSKRGESVGVGDCDELVTARWTWDST